ncbi:MAG: protease modulator HflC [Candidatus Eisenbacteria bacterium]|nr:protease modulator HflC [Candidatus Eisenbacteria bacterium]
MSDRRKWALGAVGVIAAVYLLSSFYVVDVTEYVVVTLFGNPVAVHTEPGLHFDLRKPIESINRIDARLLTLDLPPTEYHTEDKINVVASGYTLWRVEDPLLYLRRVYNRRGAETRITDILSSEIGSAVGRTPMAALVSTDSTRMRLDEVVGSILEKGGERIVRDYGIRIEDFRVKRLAFPEQNKESVFQRMRTERHRIAKRFRSEGEEQALRIRADADKQKSEILAEARRQADEIRGGGEAEATRIMAEAIRLDPDFYTFLRTLESYEKIVSDKTTLVISGDSDLMRLLTTGRTSGGGR